MLIFLVVGFIISAAIVGNYKKLDQSSFNDTRADKPNIVLLMADDMGYECLSSNGSLSHNTAVLGKLGEEGIKFNYAISQPLCTPSRVKIMTGKYNYRNYKAFG